MTIALLALPAAFIMAGCSSGSGTDNAGINEIAAQQQKQTPKGLPTIPPEKAHEGAMMAGPHKGK